MILEDEIFTTDGRTRSTTGSNPRSKDIWFSIADPDAVERLIVAASTFRNGDMPVFAVVHEPAKPPASKETITTAHQKVWRV
jgi:hypothetical protein